MTRTQEHIRLRGFAEASFQPLPKEIAMHISTLIAGLLAIILLVIGVIATIRLARRGRPLVSHLAEEAKPAAAKERNQRKRMLSG